MTSWQEDAFRLIVPQAVPGVLAGLAPAVEEEVLPVFVLHFENGDVRIGWNYNHVATALRQPCCGSVQSSELVDLHHVLEVAAPQLNEQERYPYDMTRSSRDQIRDEVVRRLMLVRDHSLELLSGDGERWREVITWYHEWLAFRRCQPEESQEQCAERLRAAASQALDEGRYWRAGDLYWRIHPQYATKEDRRRRREAARHTFVRR